MPYQKYVQLSLWSEDPKRKAIEAMLEFNQRSGLEREIGQGVLEMEIKGDWFFNKRCVYSQLIPGGNGTDSTLE